MPGGRFFGLEASLQSRDSGTFPGILSARGGDLRDEPANQPVLLFQTIAPNVDRERLELWKRTEASKACL